MSSFDIVSEINFQEVDNAVNQATKEITARYDFKGIATTMNLDQKEKKIVVQTKDEFHLKSTIDILQSKLIKRGVSIKALTYSPVVPAAGASVRQEINLQVGIDKEHAKNLVKLIKDTKRKVQA